VSQGINDQFKTALRCVNPTLAAQEPFKAKKVQWSSGCREVGSDPAEDSMGGIIYLVGLVVIVMAVLSLIGLR
jgi:hypothetical protein